MRKAEKVFDEIDQLARKAPDPMWSSADIRELIEEFASDGEKWHIILEHYSRSAAPTIVIAIAWCLAVDGEQESPLTSLEDALRLVPTRENPHPNLVHMILEAIGRRVHNHPSDPQFVEQQLPLRRFLLECGGYSGEEEFVVWDSWLAALEHLRDAELLGVLLDPQTRKGLRVRLLNLRGRLDGVFMKQVNDLLLDLKSN